MVNALINWSLTAVTMNFEGIIAIINLNQWFITAVMWSFLLEVSRASRSSRPGIVSIKEDDRMKSLKYGITKNTFKDRFPTLQKILMTVQ